MTETQSLPPGITEALASPPRRGGPQVTHSDQDGTPTPVSDISTDPQPYDTLVKAEPVGVKGKRPYRVQLGHERYVYVFTNSQAQAALAICEVATVTQKELLSAMAAAVKAK